MRKRIVKRPLFYSILLLVGLLILFSEVRYGQIKKKGEFRMEDLALSGKITDRAIQNNQIVIYLHSINLYGQSAEQSAEETNEYLRFLGRKQGVVCYFNIESYELSDFVIGDEITVSGDLATFNIATNPGEFDMQKYYMAKGYGLCMKKACLIDAAGKSKTIRQWLCNTKEKAGACFVKYMSTEDAGIMKALIFADKSDLEREDKELFREGGILHILSISGLHISLIADILNMLCLLIYLPMKLERKIGKYRCFIPILLICLYGYMLGSQPSVMRAVIMSVAVMLGRSFGRTVDNLTTLSIAAFISLCIIPSLTMDAGFRLSYMAIVGISTIGEAFYDYHNSKPAYWQRLLASTAVTTATLPVIMNSYYQIPLYGMLANVFVIPLMSVLVISGFMICIADLVFIPVAEGFAFITKAILFFIRQVCTFFEKLPFNMIITGHRPTYRMIIFYVLIILIALLVIEFRRRIWIRKRLIKNCVEKGKKEANPSSKKARINTERIYSEKRWLEKTNCFLNVLWICTYLLLIVFILLPVKTTDNKVFLDVGQGDGEAFISDRSLVLVDGGSSTNSKLGEYVLIPFIKYYGKTRVDIWFLSHADSDHISGIMDVLNCDDIGVEAIAVPEVLYDDFTDIIKVCKEKEISVYTMSTGDSVRVDDVLFTCLSPDNKYYADANAASMVLMMEREGTNEHTLLMADAGCEAEVNVIKYLSNNNISHIDIYKASHHGSANGNNSKEFIRSINPLLTIISCGKDNVYGHPHKETISYLTEVKSLIRRTDEEGAIGLK